MVKVFLVLMRQAKTQLVDSVVDNIGLVWENPRNRMQWREHSLVWKSAGGTDDFAENGFAILFD